MSFVFNRVPLIVLVNHELRSFARLSLASLEEFERSLIAFFDAESRKGVVDRKARSSPQLQRLRERTESVRKKESGGLLEVRVVQSGRRFEGHTSREIGYFDEEQRVKRVWVSGLEKLDPEGSGVRQLASMADMLELLGRVSGNDFLYGAKDGTSWIELARSFRGIPVLVEHYDLRGRVDRRISALEFRYVETERKDFEPPEGVVGSSLMDFGEAQ